MADILFEFVPSRPWLEPEKLKQQRQFREFCERLSSPEADGILAAMERGIQAAIRSGSTISKPHV